MTCLEMDKGGTSRAAMELVSRLEARDDVDLLQVRHEGNEPSTPVGRIRRGLQRELWYFPRTLPRWIEREHPDVIHCPAPITPTRSAAPLVMTLHDVIALDRPEWMSRRIVRYQRSLLPKMLDRAAHVITSSDYSRSRIVELFDLAPEKITTVPLGIDPRFSPGEVSDEALAAMQVRRPFILSVGTLQPRKNIVGAIAGFEAFMAESGSDHQLVIVGARGWRDDELLARVAASPQADSILIAGRVSDEQLIDLYRAADVFVFPSRYEGFGFPPLEAMACGTAVVSSDRTSLAEVIGDVGVTVDPDDAPQIGAAITQLVASPERRAELAARGVEHTKTFNWDHTTDLTLGVYRRAIEQSR